MGKRSDFERNPRDYYPTPYSAVEPLINHINMRGFYYEPCAGDGRLIDHLEKHGVKFIGGGDIEPQRDDICEFDALHHLIPAGVDGVITNPPWRRDFLHPFIEHLRVQRMPAWLLFDADWMHTKQAADYLPYCSKIVSIGRVSWLENGTSGKDNCAWYRFGPHIVTRTEFVGR